MTPVEIQRALIAAGYDVGPTGADGKIGPHTQAAIRKFQADHHLTVDGKVGPQTTAALRGGTAAATPAAAAGDDFATYQAKYPQFAWAFQDPDVRDALRQAMANKWGPDELQGAIMQTKWWKNKTNAERDWLQTLATNPKEAERQLNNYDSITKYIGTAAAYGQKVSFEAAARQVDRVVRGEIAPDALTEELRMQAKALYPYLAQQIDQGGTVADVFEPIKNAAADVLGLNPEEVQLSDSKWASLMQTPDGKGGFKLPSRAEVEQRLRTDPTYGFDTTQNGRDNVVGLIGALNSGFGFEG